MCQYSHISLIKALPIAGKSEDSRNGKNAILPFYGTN